MKFFRNFCTKKICLCKKIYCQDFRGDPKINDNKVGVSHHSRLLGFVWRQQNNRKGSDAANGIDHNFISF